VATAAVSGGHQTALPPQRHHHRSCTRGRPHGRKLRRGPLPPERQRARRMDWDGTQHHAHRLPAPACDQPPGRIHLPLPQPDIGLAGRSTSSGERPCHIRATRQELSRQPTATHGQFTARTGSCPLPGRPAWTLPNFQADNEGSIPFAAPFARSNRERSAQSYCVRPFSGPLGAPRAARGRSRYGQPFCRVRGRLTYP
jgi:hypothetical protein